MFIPHLLKNMWCLTLVKCSCSTTAMKSGSKRMIMAIISYWFVQDDDHSVNVYVHRLVYSSFNSMTIPEDQCYRSSSFQLVSQSENRLWVTDTTTTTQQQSNVLWNIFLLLSRNDVRKQHVYSLVSSISYYQCTYISLSINDVNADNINWKMQLSTDDEGRSDYGLTRLTWMVILDLNAWLYYGWRVQEVLIQDLEHSLRQIWWHWR